MRHTRTLFVGLTAAALATSLVGCMGGGGSDSSDSSKKPASKSSKQAGGGQTFGAGCKAVPKSGKGSFKGMTADPVATAASNNPALSTLTTAVKKAGLVDTLNSADSLTVFAPTNDAFKKVPKKDMKALLGNKKMLTKVLTYHAVKGKKSPKQLSSGAKLKTMEGQTVTPKGSGESYTVNKSKVVCGNVPTSNATVYLIDTVMMPPKK